MSDTKVTVQRKNRSRGWYYEVIIGADRRGVSLGYLSDDVADRVRARARGPLGALVANLSDVDTIRQILTSDDVSRWERARPLPPSQPWDPTTPTVPTTTTAPQPTTTAAPTNKYGAMTLRDFHGNVWWPVRRGEVAASTVRRESQMWEHILGALGDVRVCDLDAVTWQGFRAARVAAGWGPTSIRLVQNAYRVCLSHAHDIGAIGSVHAFRPVKGASAVSENARALSDDEFSKLLANAPSDVHRALWGLLGGNGLRPSEALRLTWDAVCFERGLVWPAGSKNKSAKLAVPMMPTTRTTMYALWLSLDCPADGPCFTWNGAPIVDMRTALESASERAGICHVRPYDFRHTFASAMARADVGRAAARRLMRHSSVSTILERAYEHLDAADVADVGLPDLAAAK